MSTGRARGSAAVLLAACLAAAAAAAQPPEPVPTPAPAPGADPDSITFVVTTESVDSRDSLMSEIRLHTRMIRSLRDSLAGDGLDLQLSPERREALQKNIDDISGVIEQIGNELSDLEFEVKDNRISLINDAGEGIVINIPEQLPENLDKQVTEGLRTLTQIILQELPDSLSVDKRSKWDWRSFVPNAPPPPRKVIRGNKVAIRDDLEITESQDVRGNAVVVWGDAVIDGRVAGDVVAVFGSLTIGPTAEITGTVVGVGSRVETDPKADVGEVHSVNLLGDKNELSLTAFLSQRLLSFAVFQVLFLLVVLLTIISVVAAPGNRFGNVVDQLRGGPGASFGLGLVVGLACLLVLPLLMVLLVATFVGIPVALLLAVAVAGMLVISLAASASVIGRRLCEGLGGRCRTPWMTALVGLAALYLVFFLGTVLNALGGAGGMAAILLLLGLGVQMLASTFGLGALVLTRFGARGTSG